MCFFFFFGRFTFVFGNVNDAFGFVLYRFIFCKVSLRIVMNPYVFEFSEPPWRKFSRVQDFVFAAKTHGAFRPHSSLLVLAAQIVG